MANSKDKVQAAVSEELGADGASAHEEVIEQLLEDMPEVEVHLTPNEAAEQVICGTI